MASKMVKLNYWVSNCGDGSVAVHFTPTKADAAKAENQEREEYGEGWAEPSASFVQLEIKDNELYLVMEKFDPKRKKFRTIKTAIS